MIRSYEEQLEILLNKIESGMTTLYKYCSIGTAEKILRDGAVLMKPAVDFNDPFELHCRIRLPDELREQIDRQFASCPESAKAMMVEFREKMLQRTGISCFSETRENILMWSHYASGHKGACIGFSALKLLESLLKRPCIGDGPIGGAPCMVQYQDALPLWNMESEEGFGELISTKARCWDYEREWRIFNFQAAGKKQEFLPETFGQVIFGAKAAEGDKKRLACLIAKRYPAVKLLNAEISPEEYKVEFSEYDRSRG